MGSLCAHLSDTQLHNTLATHVLDLNGVSDWAVLQARATTISAALLVASSRIMSLGLREVVAKCVVCLASSDRVPVCVGGLEAIGSFANHVEGEGKEIIPPLTQVTFLMSILSPGAYPFHSNGYCNHPGAYPFRDLPRVS